MRSFAAGLALFLAFLSGTAALASYVAYDVLLDPSRAGQVVDESLQQPELQQQILTKAVPGYAGLDPRAKAAIDEAARSPEAAKALAAVSMTDDGTVSLTPLQKELGSALRANDQSRLASQVERTDAGAVRVPSTYLDRFHEARDATRKTWTGGALITLGLIALALLVSPNRRRTLRSTGITVLVAAVAVAVGYWMMPAFARAASSDPAADAVAAVLEALRSTVLLRLAVPAAVGIVLIVVGSGGSRGRPGSRRAELV
jgi:hypothetical protein